MSACLSMVDKFSETHISVVRVAQSLFLFVVLRRAHATGEHVLSETLHTKLGMENLDMEEVRSCWSPLDMTSR